MKTISWSLIFLMVSATSLAQVAERKHIEDTEPGWYKVYRFKGAKEPKKMDNRTYSIAQLSLIDSLANWMQASYLPKAGIGDIKKKIFPEVSQYEPYNAALPQGYGAVAYTWNVEYNSEGKLVRIPETETGWAIEANSVPGWPIRDFSTTTEYYFTMPSFNMSSNQEEVEKQQDLSNVPNIKPYIHFWIKNIEAGNGTEYVLLCKDNRSPFINVTKGEYLRVLEAAIQRAYDKEKTKIHDRNSGNSPKNIEYFMKYLEEKHAKRLECLKNNKEKYKGRLNEPAATSNAQPTVLLENVVDVFDGNDPKSDKFPVYTVDPSMYELCKKDKPQCILVVWNWHPGDPKEKHMHESIINNFNFDYVYNFFFYPEKVKGQPYKPVRSPFLKDAVVVLKKSETAEKTAVDKSVHFFEDFSTTSVGQKPNGWRARGNGAGVSTTVATLDGSDKWAMIAGNNLQATSLRKPLPQDFTLSYDVVVPENFTWGTKGLALLLAKEKTEGVSESFIRLKLRPGSGGSNGEAELETKFPPAYANGTKWYVATGFSNNKKVNRINVIIRKNGQALQLLIDKNIVAEYPKVVPADMQFNALSFDMANSGGENDKYYVSNIRITKD